MSQQIQLSQRQLRLVVLLLALVPAVVVLFVMLTATTHIRFQDDLRQMDAAAQQTVQQLAASADYALMSNQPTLISNAVSRITHQPQVAALRIYDATGKLWWQDGRQKPPARRTDALREYRAAVVAPSLLADPDDWLAGNTLPARVEQLGEVRMWIATDVIAQHERGILLQVGLLAFCALLLILAVAWWISKHVLARYALLAYDEQRQRSISQDLMRQANNHWRAEQALQTRWGKWSHDVRTPLHGVSGLLELLDTTELDEEQQTYVRSAREAAGALEHSLRNNPLAGATEQFDGLSDMELRRAESCWHDRRILLLEDDPVSAHLMSTLLQSWGVRLTCVSTGHAGLLALQQSWDLILLDGELPDYNAVEWWRAMKLLPASACALQGPIVVITAHDDDEHLQLFQHAGFDPVLIKPVRGRQLLSVLTPLLRVH
ncbi:MAG: response regulator [Pseudomonadota bacterium]